MLIHLCQIRPAKVLTSASRVRHFYSFSNNKKFLTKQTFKSLFFTFNHKPSGYIFRYASGKKLVPAKSEFFRLLSLAKNEKWKLSGAVLLLLFSSAVSMSVPFCVGKIIDIMVSHENEVRSSLLTICQVLVAVFAVGAAANFGRVYLMNVSSQKIINDLRKKVYASILSQETAFFDKHKTGELINRLSADTTAVGTSLTQNASDGLRSLFMILVSSSLMIYTSPQLASVGLATVAPVAGLAIMFRKRMKENSRNLQDALANATQVAEERISNIRTVLTFLKIQKENQVYGSEIDFVMKFAEKDALSRAVFYGMAGFSGNLIILSVLYYGGQMMSEKLITIGGLSSFLMYAAYVGISIAGLTSSFAEMMRGVGASSRLWEIIDRTSQISLEGGITLPELKGDIRFNGVTFAYPSRPDVPVLSDFNLSIPAGSSYAIVGPSGCGKSTVGSLLLRLYDVQKGTISVDGHDIKSFNLEWLRRNIGTVNQDPVLFSFSVGENVMYGASESRVIGNDVIELMKKANALDFVDKMPQKLNTVVGERGVMLSGGQRQRLAIARALVQDPKVLVLDEATSALDSENEYLVQKGLEDLLKNHTVITIAHRLSTVKNADVIVVLENGKVVENGKYDELLSARGTFYNLVQRQNLKQL